MNYLDFPRRVIHKASNHSTGTRYGNRTVSVWLQSILYVTFFIVKRMVVLTSEWCTCSQFLVLYQLLHMLMNFGTENVSLQAVSPFWFIYCHTHCQHNGRENL
jgi:hypothetical protein